MKIILCLCVASMLGGCTFSPALNGVAGNSHYNAVLFSSRVATFDDTRANSPPMEYPRETPIIVTGFDR